MRRQHAKGKTLPVVVKPRPVGAHTRSILSGPCGNCIPEVLGHGYFVHSNCHHVYPTSGVDLVCSCACHTKAGRTFDADEEWDALIEYVGQEPKLR